VVRARCRKRRQAALTSHPVAAKWLHQYPPCSGLRAREGGTNLRNGMSQPGRGAVRPPGSNEADRASWTSSIFVVRLAYVVFNRAPSGTSP
jgi:hypothetical protein